MILLVELVPPTLMIVIGSDDFCFKTMFVKNHYCILLKLLPSFEANKDLKFVLFSFLYNVCCKYNLSLVDSRDIGAEKER